MKPEQLETILEQVIRDLIHKYGSNKGVALKVGIEESSFSRKLTGINGWTPAEIAAILGEGGYALIKSEELTAYKVLARKGIDK